MDPADLLSLQSSLVPSRGTDPAARGAASLQCNGGSAIGIGPGAAANLANHPGPTPGGHRVVTGRSWLGSNSQAPVPGFPPSTAPEPRVGDPERYSKVPEGCNSFLMNYFILLALQPHTFASEAARVDFAINHLAGEHVYGEQRMGERHASLSLLPGFFGRAL